MTKRLDKSKMACNKPRRTSGGSKKFVVKACQGGKESGCGECGVNASGHVGNL